MTDEAQIPKQDLLLKLLNMTTSDNDNITCMSIRKANKLLADSGWSWEKLLAGKIKVVADPFGAVNPFEHDNRENRASPPYAPPRPRTPPRAATFKPPPPVRPAPAGGASTGRWSSNGPNVQQTPPMQFTARAAIGATKTISSRTNNYSNHCYMCGDAVASGDGFIFKAVEINPMAKNGWEVLCKSCNTKVDDVVSRTRAPKWANVNQPTTANL